MIGRMNAIGVPEVTRENAVRRAASRDHSTLPAKAPVLGAEQAANRVLKKAVESIQFLDTYKPRGTPDGDQSDRMHQADRDASSHGALGTALDVTA